MPSWSISAPHYFKKSVQETAKELGLHYAEYLRNAHYAYLKTLTSKDFDRAKLLIERSYEVSMRVNGRAGDIFGLKNFGWTDKSEVIVKDKDNITDAERADLRALLRTKKPLQLVKGA